MKTFRVQYETWHEPLGYKEQTVTYPGNYTCDMVCEEEDKKQICYHAYRATEIKH